jgi:hypothetical protein
VAYRGWDSSTYLRGRATATASRRFWRCGAGGSSPVQPALSRLWARISTPERTCSDPLGVLGWRFRGLTACARTAVTSAENCSSWVMTNIQDGTRDDLHISHATVLLSLLSLRPVPPRIARRAGHYFRRLWALSTSARGERLCCRLRGNKGLQRDLSNRSLTFELWRLLVVSCCQIGPDFLQ